MNIPQIFADPTLQGWAEHAIKQYLEATSEIDPAQAPKNAKAVAPERYADAVAAAHEEINADPKWAGLADRIRSQSYGEFVATMTEYARSDTMENLRNAIKEAITWHDNSPLPSPDNIGHGEIIAALQESPQTAVQQVAFNIEIDPFTVTIFLGCSSPIDYTDLTEDIVFYIVRPEQRFQATRLSI